MKKKIEISALELEYYLLSQQDDKRKIDIKIERQIIGENGMRKERQIMRREDR